MEHFEIFASYVCIAAQKLTEGVRKTAFVRNLPIAGNFIERWGKNLKMFHGKILRIRIF